MARRVQAIAFPLITLQNPLSRLLCRRWGIGAIAESERNLAKLGSAIPFPVRRHADYPQH